jgi:CBS domain-containing protein
MRAKDILAAKGTRVVTVPEESRLIDVLSLFFANRIGSLVVVDNHNVIEGIVAPNDVLKALHENPTTIAALSVGDVMTREVIAADPEETVDNLMSIMTEHRIRHIPIIEGGKLAGLVSLGDVVKAQLKDKHVEIHYLKDYLEGKYPA